MAGSAPTDFVIRPLTTDTWDAFVALCDRHGGGGFGGCYCTWFHLATHGGPSKDGPPPSAERTRLYKQDRVANGLAHAALVFDGDAAVGWAQYGSLDELPGISHRKDVAAAGADWADWRITCVFVDRAYRRRGVARVAVEGALGLIDLREQVGASSHVSPSPMRSLPVALLQTTGRVLGTSPAASWACRRSGTGDPGRPPRRCRWGHYGAWR